MRGYNSFGQERSWKCTPGGDELVDPKDARVSFSDYLIKTLRYNRSFLDHEFLFLPTQRCVDVSFTIRSHLTSVHHGNPPIPPHRSPTISSQASAKTLKHTKPPFTTPAVISSKPSSSDWVSRQAHSHPALNLILVSCASIITLVFRKGSSHRKILDVFGRTPISASSA